MAGAIGGGTGLGPDPVLGQRAVGPKLSLVLVQVMDRTVVGRSVPAGHSPRGGSQPHGAGHDSSARSAEPVHEDNARERPAVGSWGGLRRLLRPR